jgi:hypothetical protein
MGNDQDADPRRIHEADLAQVKHHSFKPAVEQVQEPTLHFASGHELDLAEHTHL